MYLCSFFAVAAIEDVARLLEGRERVGVHHLRPQVAVVARRIAAHDVQEVRDAVAHDDLARHAEALQRRRARRRRRRARSPSSSACRSMSTNADARYSMVAKPWLKLRAALMRVEQLVRHRLAGLVVQRELLQHLRHASASARRAARAARRSRASPLVPEMRRIGHVRQAGRAGRGRTRGTACARRRATAASARPPRPRAKFMTLTMIGRDLARQLLTASGTPTSRRPSASRAARNNRRGTAPTWLAALVGHLPHAHVRMIARRVGQLLELQAEQARSPYRRRRRSRCRAAGTADVAPRRRS